jgi:hypothetical protein
MYNTLHYCFGIIIIAGLLVSIVGGIESPYDGVTVATTVRTGEYFAVKPDLCMNEVPHGRSCIRPTDQCHHPKGYSSLQGYLICKDVPDEK